MGFAQGFAAGSAAISRGLNIAIKHKELKEKRKQVVTKAAVEVQKQRVNIDKMAIRLNTDNNNKVARFVENRNKALAKGNIDAVNKYNDLINNAYNNTAKHIAQINQDTGSNYTVDNANIDTRHLATIHKDGQTYYGLQDDINAIKNYKPDMFVPADDGTLIVRQLDSKGKATDGIQYKLNPVPESKLTESEVNISQYKQAVRNGSFKGSLLKWKEAQKQKAERKGITTKTQTKLLDSGENVYINPNGTVKLDPDGKPIVKSRVKISEEEKTKAKMEASKIKNAKKSVFFQSLDALSSLIKEDRALTPISGILGSFAQYIPGTERERGEDLLKTIQGNITLDKLQAMRDASPNGSSGLGQVTEQEHKYLINSIGAINLNQDKEIVAKQIENVRRAYDEIVYGKDYIEQKLKTKETLPEGSIIHPDGSISFPDGSTYQPKGN